MSGTGSPQRPESAADHETALQRVKDATAWLADYAEEGCGLNVEVGQRRAAILAEFDALVGLLRQTEQERGRAHSEGVLWAQSRMQRRLSEAEQEVERLKRGNQERENQIRETPTGVVVEDGEPCWCCREPAPIRGKDDPWEGRLDGYCENCATARCDAYPGDCGNRPTSTTNAERSPDSDSAPVCVRCVRLEEALRELAEAAGYVIAGRDDGSMFAAIRDLESTLVSIGAALAAVGVPPDRQDPA